MFHASGADEDGIFTLQVCSSCCCVYRFPLSEKLKHLCVVICLFLGAIAWHGQHQSKRRKRRCFYEQGVNSKFHASSPAHSFICRHTLPERALTVLPFHMLRACSDFGAAARVGVSFEAAPYRHPQPQTCECDSQTSWDSNSISSSSINLRQQLCQYWKRKLPCRRGSF